MEVGNIQLDALDPLYEVKKTTLQGLSEMSSGVAAKRTEMYNLVLYVLAIIITVPLSFAVEYRNWFWIFFIAVLLIVFLDYNLWRMKKEKKSFSLAGKQLLKQARALGLDHPSWKKF